jgi:hypothetical protein
MAGTSARPVVEVQLTSHGTTLTGAATGLAGAVFDHAGLTVEWQARPRGTSASTAPVLSVELVVDTPDDYRPGALAEAFPYSPCSKRITVFADRIRSVTRNQNDETALLAFVLAHEMTHVLQGIVRHSDTGLMKARWSPDDQAAIVQRRLTMSDADVRLLQLGVRSWSCDGPAAVTRRSAPGNGSRQD